jgi:hypothetical protein
MPAVVERHGNDIFYKQKPFSREKRENFHNCIMAADSSETIQEIAFKLMLEQNKNEKILNGTKTERTIFVLGSPYCVINLFY